MSTRKTRKRRLTIEQKTTETITRVTAEETTDVLSLAPGWDDPAADHHFYLAQRAGQVERCTEFLAIWAASADPGAPVPSRLIGDATVILRAGPGATLSELTLGRSV